MTGPAWYRAIPQPFRWAVAGALPLAVLGAIFGGVESVRDYPVTSWFGVTLYLLFLAGIVGFVLGGVAGTGFLVVRAAFRRA